MEEQNAVKTPGTAGPNRQAEIAETLRKKVQNLRKQRSRAKGRDDEEILQWEISFDLERLSKDGGLIDIHEVAPFVDCESAQEQLNTCRIFAHAFRRAKIECPDIGPEETIDLFIRRCVDLWYRHKSPNGVQLFVGLKTLEFDDDLGFHHEQLYDFSGWQPWPDSDVTVDIAALPMVGKPEPEWKKEGFENWQDWNEHLQKKQKLKKDLEEFEKTLPTPEELERRLQTPTEPTKDSVPTLLYQGVIIEH